MNRKLFLEKYGLADQPLLTMRLFKNFRKREERDRRILVNGVIRQTSCAGFTTQTYMVREKIKEYVVVS